MESDSTIRSRTSREHASRADADSPPPDSAAGGSHSGTPDRRAAFQKYAEHADQTFRSELYNEKPRQVLLLAIMGAFLLAISARRMGETFTDPVAESRANAQTIFLAVVVVFGVYGATQLRDSLMVRPHPMVWRVMHAMAVLYLLLLCAIFVLPLQGARDLIRLLSPEVIPDLKPVDPLAPPPVSVCRVLCCVCVHP